MDEFGCLLIVLDGFRWFSEICRFSSYGEIRCFKFKKSRQLWEVFVVSNNNDAKVPFKKWPRFWVVQNMNFQLKRPLVGKRNFFF